MKATKDKRTGRWKFYVPPSITGTGKRQYKSFDTKTKAEEKMRRFGNEVLIPLKSKVTILPSWH